MHAEKCDTLIWRKIRWKRLEGHVDHAPHFDGPGTEPVKEIVDNLREASIDDEDRCRDDDVLRTPFR